jgi:hypothetical protein
VGTKVSKLSGGLQKEKKNLILVIFGQLLIADR